MRIAIATIFMFYAGMQLSVVARASNALALSWPASACLVAWVALMTALPLLVWRWEYLDWHRPVVVGAWIGYTWMGVVFLFFWIALGLDLAGGLLSVGGAHLYLSARNGFLLAGALTVVVSVYGFIAARRLRIERVVLASPKFPAGSQPLRIALISDVHLGALVGRRRLQAILDALRNLDPDVLVSAGDLVDGQADRLNGLAPMFAALRPRHGKFAVTGNHEYLVGLERALEFHERAGFTLLRGTTADITETVTFAGVDDPIGNSMGLPASTDEHRLLAGRDVSRFVVLLKHQPRLDRRATGLFDLQLSGHVHHGQIFPFGLLVRLSYPVATGLTRIAGAVWLYVSRGTGTWGPPMRVAAPAEITLIELRPAG
jgi:predicted MPP superfamily phosphohydrolase